MKEETCLEIFHTFSEKYQFDSRAILYLGSSNIHVEQIDEFTSEWSHSKMILALSLEELCRWLVGKM